MFTVDFLSRVPIFEQIQHQVEEYIRLGILKNGDKLPSIRELTETVGVNPNTIAKAYNSLDKEGIIVSAAGRGCFISENASDIIRAKAEEKLPQFTDMVKTLLTSGISEETLIRIIREAKE